MSKLLIVIFVFIIVFTPQKLPSFIREISKLFASYISLKKKLISFIDGNIAQELILNENIRKAQAADSIYTEINKDKNQIN